MNGSFRFPHGCSFSDFDFKPFRFCACLTDAGQNLFRQFFLHQLDGGDIHADSARPDTCLFPGNRLPARLGQHPVGNGAHETDFLGQRDEFIR